MTNFLLLVIILLMVINSYYAFSIIKKANKLLDYQLREIPEGDDDYQS